ncbi:MAG: transglutaminase family protein [Rhodococcus sp. (in: high G+C Gram-positive bacteria)]
MTGHPQESSTRRYRITHETAYTYSDSVKSSFGRGFLTPRDFEGQRVVESSVTVSPSPADQSSGHDVYGNDDVFFHVTRDHDELVVTARSLVDVDPPDPARLTTGDAARPWENARPRAGSDIEDGRAMAVEFVLDLVPPEISPEVRDYALRSFTPNRPLVDAIVDLTTRIFTDFTYKSGSTTVSTRVAEVMDARAGVCQDFARLAIACLRSIGLAARYVSGYLATQPPPGKERMIGADATHAWAAVWLPGDVWLAFDPTNDQLVDERYATVAWGRDYNDVPPLRGIIYTDAERSTINVSVDVAPVAYSTADAPAL